MSDHGQLIETIARWSGLPLWHVAGLLAVVLLVLGWVLTREQR